MSHVSVYWFLKGIYLHIYHWVPPHMWHRVNNALGFYLRFTIHFPLSFLYPPSIHSIRESSWIFPQTTSESKFFSPLPLLHYGLSPLDYGSILQASLPSSTRLPLKHMYTQLAVRLTLKSKLLKSKSLHGPNSGTRPVCWLPIISLTCLLLLPSLLIQIGLPVALTHIWTLQLQILCSHPLQQYSAWSISPWLSGSLTPSLL